MKLDRKAVMFVAMDFQKTLLVWYEDNKRALPWRETNNPYVIWLSEIILQQTRVEQGTPYFLRFLENYPTVSHFAKAEEAEVLKLWQGLGYYSRARNMHATAKKVVAEYDGVFPSNYESLLKLKGIGPYSAAAISSFSIGEQKAVLDGNVFRVLARYFGIEAEINSTKGIAQFTKLAQELLYLENPGLYNQAIMEFGALQCKPKNPDCGKCPLSQTCVALNGDLVNVLPKKLPKAAKRHRFLNYFVCVDKRNVMVRHRQAGDIWQQLYDFPCIETTESASLMDGLFLDQVKLVFGEDTVIHPRKELRHILTHQLLHIQFFQLTGFSVAIENLPNCRWVELDKLQELPQPVPMSAFTENFL